MPSWGQWLASLRWAESAGLQVLPILGLLYSGDPGSDRRAVALLLAGLFLLLVHSFALNDWANREADAHDPRKADRTARQRRFTPATMRNGTLVLGLGALALLAVLPSRVWPWSLWLTLAGVLYSHPRLAMKRLPFASSGIHLISGGALFLAGGALFAPVSTGALLVGLWCGLVLAGGHLVQEVQDHEGDMAAAVRTHAVRFGRRRMLVVAFALFAASFTLLAGLVSTSHLPAGAWPALLLFPSLVLAFRAAARRGLHAADVVALRRRYRAIFALVALVLGAALWSS
jgi:4-hydroxybenzoate polyprenyltransferase